jgi:hypothetical protein
MKNDMYELPDNMYDFAQFADYHGTMHDLASLAETEDWNYKNTTYPDTDIPILENYFNNTYKRIAIEKKIAYSSDNQFCCFDTGLITKAQREPIYSLFVMNANPTIDCYWHFKKFFRKGEHEVSKFYKLPDMAFYWEDPSKLVYYIRKELVVNKEHIIQDNKNRFPAPYNTLPDYNLLMYLDGCVKSSIEKVRRNYKTAIPQYFLTAGTIQLLIPLYLSNSNDADLALVVEDYGLMYRASTCLTLDMAINNARLLARPDRDWLNP